jgi:type I restriction enzyme S subunit
VPFYKVGDMNAHPTELRWARTHLAPEELGALRLATVPAGSSVFPKVGGAVLTNKKRLVVTPGAIDLNTMAVVPGPDLEPRYLRAWLERLDLRSLVDGSILPQISKSRVQALQIPLPGFPEQRKVADLLDDHLSRLDAASDLLQRSERRLIAWERAAAAQCQAGDLVPLADVTEIQGGIQKQPKRAPREGGVPFLRVANVGREGLDLSDIHKIQLFGQEIERYRLQTGDLLVVEGNGSPSQIGRAATWDGSIADCVHQNHLIRVRPTREVLPAYLEVVWNSPGNREALRRLASSSSGLHTLSVAKLKSLEIPVPSLDEQASLTDSFARLREERVRLTAAVAAAYRRAGALRRSVLDAALSGRLTGGGADTELAEKLAATGV